VVELLHFLSCRLSKKDIFIWGNLRDLFSHSWKEWHSLSQEYGLLSCSHPLDMELQSLNLEVELYKLNIGIHGPF